MIITITIDTVTIDFTLTINGQKFPSSVTFDITPMLSSVKIVKLDKLV